MQPKNQQKSETLLKWIFFSLLVAGFLFVMDTISADTAAEIRQKIEENNKKIDEIQRQIDQYSTLLNSTSKQAQTLKDALATLELTQKKLEANLALTTRQISKTSLTLQELTGDINEAEDRIASTTAVIATNIREIEMTESQSAIETLLNNKSMSETWDYINALRTIQGRTKAELEELRDTRELLGAKRSQALGEKTKLESYQKSLSDQQKVVASNKDTKNKLLQDTKNQEASYKALIAQKTKEREEYEKELYNYESQLKITIDPNAIPEARHSILSWPMDSVTVTQFFGKTVSAKRLYTSGTHNGIDFRAPIGSPIKAALSGTVTDTEATKFKSGCQYGKYVLIKHANGMSTIYGHLSVVSVKPGDTVSTGQIIGYSGDTGYATGPHLHLGVYATQGIKIVDSKTLGSTRCSGIKTVAAPPTAYLDPMAYLPAL